VCHTIVSKLVMIIMAVCAKLYMVAILTNRRKRIMRIIMIMMRRSIMA
jgi:hypothetical protein